MIHDTRVTKEITVTFFKLISYPSPPFRPTKNLPSVKSLLVIPSSFQNKPCHMAYNLMNYYLFRSLYILINMGCVQNLYNHFCIQDECLVSELIRNVLKSVTKNGRFLSENTSKYWLEFTFEIIT